jgi:hypothetical protein
MLTAPWVGALPPSLGVRKHTRTALLRCQTLASCNSKLGPKPVPTCTLAAARLYCNTPARNEQQGRSPCPACHPSRLMC